MPSSILWARKSNPTRLLCLWGVCCISIPFFSDSSAIAQAIPDSSLATESSIVAPTVVNGQPTEVISGGASRGQNLFHSFESFSIPAGQSIYFLDPDSATRIFSRVTGNGPSNIQGTLGVLGNSDLFFINQNGIVFGAESQLALGGSFIGSTAKNIQFSDGVTLSTASPDSPLLSNSIPTGLGLSGNSSINVNNEGREVVGNIFFDELSQREGLAVLPFQTLALIGGEINLEGGILRSPEGEISIASIQEGNVSLAPRPFGWTIDSFEGDVFGDVTFSQLSLADASGLSGGQINILGRFINLRNGSVASIRSAGGTPAGRIGITATEELDVGQSNRPEPLVSSIFSQNLGGGRGADIFINSPIFTVRDGGQIIANTLSLGSSGDIKVSAPVSLTVDGFSSISENIASGISTSAIGGGNAGRFSLEAGNVLLSSGGQIGSVAGAGSPGPVDIVARDIIVEGALPTLLKPSFLGIATAGRGNSEQLSIEANSVRVLSGGAVGTSTIGSGNAGNTFIRATDFVEVSGSFPGAINPSIIDSSSTRLNPVTQDFIRFVPPTPLRGNAGGVSVIVPRLVVQNGGAIRVQNDGPGDAGNLNLEAERIQLLSGGLLSAVTNGGRGGSIGIVSNSLLIDSQAAISASALGGGQGGNITINSDGIALLQNSSITANAEQGAGGRVTLSAEALLQSPNSLISASSAAGAELDGSIEIQAPDEAPNTTPEIQTPAMELPQITAVCADGRDESEFIITGRGGLPASPANLQHTSSGWLPDAPVEAVATAVRPSQIIEAQGWVSNGDGTVSFTNRATDLGSAATQPTACVNSPVSQN